MAPRQRKQINRGLPDHTRVRDGYYSWTSPIDGVEHGLGRDRQKAIGEARAANAWISQQRATNLVDKISGRLDRSWGKWLDKYEKILMARKLADNTRRTYKSLLTRTRAAFDESMPVQAISTVMIADAIDALIEAGKHRIAQAWRSFLKDIFREAIAQGWTQSNPTEVTRAVEVTVRRARLSLEVFLRVYDLPSLPVWLRNAMALALVTGQRREDVAAMQFRDAHDGGLWVDQGKTGSRVIVPLSLRLDAFGMSVEEVIRQCRSTGVLSPHLVHQTERFGNSPAGQCIWVDTISRRFTAALAAFRMEWAEKSPPTFHEIRSLSERLYRAQGNVNTQELLGHKNPETTATYHDARGEWVRVSTTG